jgi:hypothetical protein
LQHEDRDDPRRVGLGVSEREGEEGHVRSFDVSCPVRGRARGRRRGGAGLARTPVLPAMHGRRERVVPV